MEAELTKIIAAIGRAQGPIIAMLVQRTFRPHAAKKAVTELKEAVKQLEKII
tara:strand:+ start:358 stop:513 length:156 start_codon:yes stop_codon:yes gene_type:complete